MRGLAMRLGVSPNALYSHVSSKTALIDEILDNALGTAGTSDAESADPITGLHTLMTASYRTLLEHADLIPLYLARQGARGPNAHRLGDIALSLLARRGVSETRAREALHVLIVYTIGSAAFSARAPIATSEDTPETAGRHATRFDQGLRWLLVGIDAELVDQATDQIPATPQGVPAINRARAATIPHDPQARARVIPDKHPDHDHQSGCSCH